MRKAKCPHTSALQFTSTLAGSLELTAYIVYVQKVKSFWVLNMMIFTECLLDPTPGEQQQRRAKGRFRALVCRASAVTVSLPGTHRIPVALQPRLGFKFQVIDIVPVADIMNESQPMRPSRGQERSNARAGTKSSDSQQSLSTPGFEEGPLWSQLYRVAFLEHKAHHSTALPKGFHGSTSPAGQN